ncbi:glutathione S-transferase N-terminal domain-containing protein [Inquilinus sp. CAU 1745]|uniref:glutathione S-transferase N-terminal domain-containing protein n=1 Tax=Inquilinus sp. CAU 1745 TaxID=3140369 RepID=UPI00325C1B6B
MMDFYYSPTTCSQAAHILLHEAGLPFRARKVDIFTGQVEDGSDYAGINPNGYVPALVFDDGALLTENVAILDWIAGQGASLIPPDDMGRTRHLQMLAFVSTELQKPFVRLFFTEREEEKAHLTETLTKRFRWIASRMEGDYIFGDRFTASDAFVYVMVRWAAMAEIDVPDELHGLARRVERREAVRTVLAKEEAEPLRGAA